MVIVVIRYVDDYSNNSLKMDTQFLINFPTQDLGFTDTGSSFFAGVLQGFCNTFIQHSDNLLSKLQRLFTSFCDITISTWYIILWSHAPNELPIDKQHIVVVCTFTTPLSPSISWHQHSFSLLQLSKKTQHTCFTRIKLWSIYLGNC